ncbi:hypothetical protein J6590_002048 [Homalodisca vitripennis]|nr:hypothetical protein J6590_002048 [Homalodisca vitripennis]
MWPHSGVITRWPPPRCGVVGIGRPRCRWLFYRPPFSALVARTSRSSRNVLPQVLFIRLELLPRSVEQFCGVALSVSVRAHYHVFRTFVDFVYFSVALVLSPAPALPALALTVVHLPHADACVGTCPRTSFSPRLLGPLYTN